MGEPLSRFQRMFLSTDGTVTHILEAYAGEPVEVVKLVQEMDTSGVGDAALDVGDDTKILRRTVLLRARRTRTNLLHADVAVVVDRAESRFLDGLIGTNTPLGRLLSEHRIETRREILGVGTEAAGELGDFFGVEPSATMVTRTYRIVSGGVPVILITERFPATSFRALPP